MSLFLAGVVALLSSSAHAAGPAEVLAESLAAVGSDEPGLAVACTPMSRVVSLTQGMGPMLAMLGQGEDQGPAMGLVQAWARPGGAEAMGFDLSGGMVFLSWEEEAFSMALPFSGSQAKADTFLVGQGLKAPSVQPFDGAAGGELAPQVAQVDRIWPESRLEGGTLHVRKGAPTGSTARPMGPLLLGMPEVDGCIVGMSKDKADGGKLGSVTAATFFPLAGGSPALIRIASEAPAPAMLARSSAPPLPIRSTEVPSAVVSLGVSPLELLKFMVELVPEAPELDFEQVEKHLRVPGGTVVGVFGDPKAMDFVAVVPFTNPKGKPLKTWKLLKRAAKQEGQPWGEIELTGKRSGRMAMKDKFVQIEALKGRMVLGTVELPMQQAIDGVGQPWVTGDFEEFAGAWPVAMGVSRDIPGSGVVDMKMGLRSKAEIWEMAVEVKGLDLNSDQGRMVAGGAGMGLAMALSNMNEVQKATKEMREADSQGAPPAEDSLASSVRDLCVAQTAYNLAFDEYVGLLPAPRAAEAADARVVPWTDPADFSRIGWRPASPELAAVYWAQTSKDLQEVVVHGVTDLDGDGEQAHYSCHLAAGSEGGIVVKQESPEGVR